LSTCGLFSIRRTKNAKHSAFLVTEHFKSATDSEIPVVLRGADPLSKGLLMPLPIHMHFSFLFFFSLYFLHCEGLPFPVPFPYKKRPELGSLNKIASITEASDK
jgi:hypothetical protein